MGSDATKVEAGKERCSGSSLEGHKQGQEMLPGWPSGARCSLGNLETLQSLVDPESNGTSATAGKRPVTGGLRCELDIHQLRITPLQLSEVTHRHRLCPFVSKERLKCAHWVLLRAGMASHSFYCKRRHSQILVT